MKAGDKTKANTLRSAIAKLKDKYISSRKDLSIQDELNVIKTLAKQRKESFEIFTKSNRVDLADKEKLELRILNKYLPLIMSKDESKRLIQNIISEIGATNLSEMGKVMPLVMKRGEGKIDGKLANSILRELLK
tara:strand:+ start:712 stop:1113 length:402 start_codon:yes stop_codon:yes gene_type:complete